MDVIGSHCVSRCRHRCSPAFEHAGGWLNTTMSAAPPARGGSRGLHQCQVDETIACCDPDRPRHRPPIARSGSPDGAPPSRRQHRSRRASPQGAARGRAWRRRARLRLRVAHAQSLRALSRPLGSNVRPVAEPATRCCSAARDERRQQRLLEPMGQCAGSVCAPSAPATSRVRNSSRTSSIRSESPPSDRRRG